MLKALCLAALGCGTVAALAPSAGAGRLYAAGAGVEAAAPITAAAGCRINIKARNDGSRSIAIWWPNSHVRTKIGVWKRMSGAVGFETWTWVGVGEDMAKVYAADFSCRAQRRWRFTLRLSDGRQHMLYIPDGRFTTSTTVDLGDVSRVF